jgi:hypothetical protein
MQTLESQEGGPARIPWFSPFVKGIKSCCWKDRPGRLRRPNVSHEGSSGDPPLVSGPNIAEPLPLRHIENPKKKKPKITVSHVDVGLWDVQVSQRNLFIWGKHFLIAL